MSYNPKEDWILQRYAEVIGHKINKYIFETKESKLHNGVKMKMVAEKYAYTEAEAWRTLTKPHFWEEI